MENKIKKSFLFLVLTNSCYFVMLPPVMLPPVMLPHREPGLERALEQLDFLLLRYRPSPRYQRPMLLPSITPNVATFRFLFIKTVVDSILYKHYE